MIQHTSDFLEWTSLCAICIILQLFDVCVCLPVRLHVCVCLNMTLWKVPTQCVCYHRKIVHWKSVVAQHNSINPNTFRLFIYHYKFSIECLIKQSSTALLALIISNIDNATLTMYIVYINLCTFPFATRTHTLSVSVEFYRCKKMSCKFKLPFRWFNAKLFNSTTFRYPMNIRHFSVALINQMDINNSPETESVAAAKLYELSISSTIQTICYSVFILFSEHKI